MSDAMVLIYYIRMRNNVRYAEAGTDHSSSMQALSVAEPLDVARYGLTKKSEHLSNGERHSHPVRTVGMARNKTPQRAKCHDRLQNVRVTKNWTDDTNLQ